MPPNFVFITNSKVPETQAECVFLAKFCSRAFGSKVILTSDVNFESDLPALLEAKGSFFYCPLLPDDIKIPWASLGKYFLLGGQAPATEVLETNYFDSLLVQFPDPDAWGKSSRPHISALGSQLFLAFSGDPEALQEGSLSLASLKIYFERVFDPEVYVQGGENNQAILSDFSAAPLARINLKSFSLKMSQALRVKEVLTQIKHWGSYSVEQIAYGVNRDLPKFFLPDLEKLAANLINAHAFASFEVEVQADEGELFFPNGYFRISYEAGDKKTGQLVFDLELEKIWLQDAFALTQLLSTLDFTPFQIDITPEEYIPLEGVIERGKARGFVLVAKGEGKVTLQKDDLEVVLEEFHIILRSSQLHKILAAEQKILSILNDLLPWG
ncbi:MAG: hypothetical protein QNL04_06830 [SAR324 cluster bacterium]|nr:hypothetical protein [SAR324 cluster bacterium]